MREDPAAIASQPTGETTVLVTPAGEEPKSGGKQTLVVPDIGDFSEVDVIEVHISPGDTVAVEDSLVTLETDKAAMDVPAVVAGKIEDVLVKVGDKISEGNSIAIIEVSGEVAGGAPTPEPEKPAEPAAPAPPQAAPAAPTPAPARAAQPASLPSIDEAGFAKAHASPSVRKLARELGVNLVQVKGTGLKNRIVHDDVKAFVKAVLSGQAAAPGGGSLPATPVVDFAKFGEIDVQPLTRIQKISGPRLQASWINLPHVTQHDLADITELEAKRQELKGPAKQRGIGLTPLAFIMKACVSALQEFPKVNASLSEDGDNLVFNKYIHLGFAADTENGLMVPVIRDADRMDVYALASALGELSKAAPARLTEELLQLLRCGHAAAAWQWMLDLGVLEVLLPEALAMIEAHEKGAGAFTGILPVLDRMARDGRQLGDPVLLGAQAYIFYTVAKRTAAPRKKH